MASSYMARQGGVLLVEVDGLPPGCTSGDRAGGEVILARGEATGHAHRVEARVASLYRAPDGTSYLHVVDSAALVHEEHDPIPVPPGTYRVVRQREYAPADRADAREPRWRQVEG